MTDFAAVLGVLRDAGVEFVLVGGVAAVAHGSARSTLDVDVVYRRGADNLDRIVAALGPHSPYPRGAPAGLPFQWDRRTLENGLNFTLSTALGDLDLLGEIVGGGGYEQLVPHSEERTIHGRTVRCLDLEMLIVVKRAAGRPKDYDAIAELELILDERRR